MPDGQVVTWYPGQAPKLSKNKGYPGELLDVDNIMVHPMPTTDVEIKAQGFPLQQSDWHDAILIFPTDTGVEAVYIAYNSGPIPAPSTEEITGFSGLKQARKKTYVQGGGLKRARWKDGKGNIFEWDSRHGALEKYNRRGVHLGEFDPYTGQQTKDADKSRRVEP